MQRGYEDAEMQGLKGYEDAPYAEPQKRKPKKRLTRYKRQNKAVIKGRRGRASVPSFFMRYGLVGECARCDNHFEKVQVNYREDSDVFICNDCFESKVCTYCDEMSPVRITKKGVIFVVVHGEVQRTQ